MKNLFLALLFTCVTFAQTQVAPTQIDARTQVKNVQPGLKGDPGIQGPPGIVWKGDWNSTITYQYGDAVFFPTTGSSYISVAPGNVGNSPDTASQWKVFARGASSPVTTLSRKTCVGSGQGTNSDGTIYMWDCTGMQMLSYTLSDGTQKGPYIAIPATSQTATDPKFQTLALNAPDPWPTTAPAVAKTAAHATTPKKGYLRKLGSAIIGR
jgi:hypothetical protein